MGNWEAFICLNIDSFIHLDQELLIFFNKLGLLFKLDYSILRVLLVYEMTWDWTATFSNQSSFDCLEGKIPVFCVALSKN